MRRPWSAARWDRVDGPLPPRHQPRGRRSGRPIGTPRTALSLSEVGSPNRHVCAGPMRTRDRDTPDTPPRPQPTRPRGIPSTDPHLATELSDRSPLCRNLTFPTKVPSDSLGWIGSLKRTSDKSLFPMALGSYCHRITHQLRPINMNGRSILAVTSWLASRPQNEDSP